MTEKLTPEALAEKGKAIYLEGDYLEAAPYFEEAAQGFTEIGDLLSAAEMKNNLSVALVQAEDGSGALTAVKGTDAVFAAAGDIRRQAMALGNLGAAYEVLEQYDEAITAFEQANDLLKEVGDDELRKHVLQSLSRIKLMTGRKLEAFANMETALGTEAETNQTKHFLHRIMEFTFNKVFKI